MFPTVHKALLTSVANKHSDVLLFKDSLKESRRLILQ